MDAISRSKYRFKRTKLPYCLHLSAIAPYVVISAHHMSAWGLNKLCTINTNLVGVWMSGAEVIGDVLLLEGCEWLVHN